MTVKVHSRTSPLGAEGAGEALRHMAVGACTALLLAMGAPALARESSAVQPTAASVRPPGISPFAMSAADRKQLEHMLHREVQELIERQERLDGQAEKITVLSIQFDTADVYGTGEKVPRLVVDMSDGYVPRNESYRRGSRHMGGRFEESMSAIQMMIEDHLRDVVSIYLVEIVIEGRNIYYYFPDDMPPELLSSAQGREISKANGVAGGVVVVSGGHGYYRHYGEKCGELWCTQREEHNGLIEDFTTPRYADVRRISIGGRGHYVQSSSHGCRRCQDGVGHEYVHLPGAARCC